MRRNSVIYLSSYGLSLLGKGIAAAVLPLLVLDRTGDVLAAGLLATVTTATSALVGILGGLLVDRVDRRRLSAVSDVLAAASIAVLPVVDLLWGLSMPWFLGVAVVGAVIRVPGMTALETLLPALVRLDGRKGSLDRLVATRETMSNVLLLGGPGVGGLLVVLLGLTPAVLFVTAGTSVVAALLTLSIDKRAGAVPERADGDAPARGGARGAVSDLAEAWRFLAASRIVLGATLVIAVFVAAISVLQTTLMPAYFTAVDLPALAGMTLSALAAGSIVGSAVFTLLTGRVSRRTWFVIGMLGTLVGFAVLATMVSPWVVLGAAALIGLTNAPVGAVLGILTIEATPDRMRGRVLGAQNALMLAAPAIITTPLAAVGASAGLPVAGAILAVFTGLTAVVALVVPAFRSLDDQEPDAPQERAHRVPLDATSADPLASVSTPRPQCSEPGCEGLCGCAPAADAPGEAPEAPAPRSSPTPAR